MTRVQLYTGFEVILNKVLSFTMDDIKEKSLEMLCSLCYFEYFLCTMYASLSMYCTFPRYNRIELFEYGLLFHFTMHMTYILLNVFAYSIYIPNFAKSLHNILLSIIKGKVNRQNGKWYGKTLL